MCRDVVGGRRAAGSGEPALAEADEDPRIVSGSVAVPGPLGRTVHEQQRAGAAAPAVALHEVGDRLALYAFHSQGRPAVRPMPIRRIDDGMNALVLQRVRGLVPGAYSRLGAAIRHGAAVLQSRGGTSRRLLVALSDGLAYHHGYERGYGAADAHRALAEARRRGIGCVCLAIGAGTDRQELRRAFGSAAHAAIARPEQLSHTHRRGTADLGGTGPARGRRRRHRRAADRRFACRERPVGDDRRVFGGPLDGAIDGATPPALGLEQILGSLSGG
ncbi:hypothetical protein AWC15_20125 [Mycobacterium lacus]|nr:hypothetical protein AWC15_20125 [Mycobacterium lacus]